MRRFLRPGALALILIASSVALYGAQYLLARDWAPVEAGFLGNVAFLPLQVLLVTLVLNRLMVERERQERLEKLNMVVGAFYSEVGLGLLRRFSGADPALECIRESLLVRADWSDQAFAALSQRLKEHKGEVEGARVSLSELRVYLLARRGFLLGLLESPTLLEHETFTELLRAVFHLAEELEMRPELSDLPPADRAHLQVDMRRAYVHVLRQWADYLRYLKASYPYLFSLALRTNPFDRDASPIIR